MPDVSPEVIANTMKMLSTGTFDMKMLWLRQRPIAPPHDAPNKLFPSNATSSQDPTQITKTVMRDVNEMVRFLKFEADILTGGITFRTKSPLDLPTNSDRAGYVPCWFLPWRSAHIIKLKIPSLRDQPSISFGGNVAPVSNPGLYFTAAINGCSVFATGNSESPNTYHAGVEGAQAHLMNLQTNETTEEGWKRLLAANRKQRPFQKAERFGSVGKNDYISELKPNATGNTDRYNKETSKSRELEAALKARGTLAKCQVNPWGAVFGLRDQAGTWHFNLVRNATVIYERLTLPPSRKQKVLGAIKNKLNTLRNGEEEETLAVHIGQRSSVNLGFQEFFPGKGVAHYRDLNNIVIV